ncbi:15539_t:CDS:1 [Cetraspora pellucida]|uniref:15539_t:CDS:1 n=1 Tax=Cetraspora pellucida TaxID=1433469 RepID=A0ACA9PE03_9GLOM|nr:15539_t:CDS:1 [Cetraspora pellucida]
MSSHGYNPPSNVRETTLPLDSINETTLSDESENNTIDPLLSEITAYFVDRGFQESLVRSFLEGEVHLDLRTNAELMFDFLEERQRLDPTVFVGIEGSGVSGIASGEDKRLLVKWGLTEEAASELRNSVCDDIIWSKQILYHWLFEWIHNPWGSFSQLSFEDIFYDTQFPCNQWINYDRKGGPQMFASSYEDIATGIDDFLSSNTKVADANTMCSTYRAFFNATNQQSAQAISKNGIKHTHCKRDLDFGSYPSFYLNPSIDHAIDWIKNRRGFTGIVVYWVNMDRIKSMKYRDLVSEGEDLWKRVVVASKCGQKSAVDDDDFVYGYQLSNPREVLSEWANNGGDDVEGSWQNAVPHARWFEPIRHLQLAIKTRRAVDLMDSYCVGVIYFHTKP